MERFPIYKPKRLRKRTDYIILVPAENFLQGKFQYPPKLLNSKSKYTWNIWEKYFLKTLKRKTLPCHYYFEQVGDDFTATVANPYYVPSYFVEDLVQFGIIDHKYIHSIVIMVGNNYNLNTITDRESTQLSYKLLNPIMHQYHLFPDRIKFIDEIFNDGWQETAKFVNCDYHLTESTYFDFNKLLPFIHKYNSYTTLT